MIDTDFVPFESTVEFEGMSKVSGVWSAFPINESSYLCFFHSAITKAWNFSSLSSKFSGSSCQIVFLQRIDKSCRSMKQWHQCTEALNSLSAMFLAFAIDFAFRRITVVEIPIPAFLFSSIHSFSSFSNSGNLAGQYHAALWLRRRPFNFSCCERHLRTFFSSTWNWRAASRFPFSKA